MEIVRWVAADADAEMTAGCYRVHVAASAADDPVEPPMSARTFGVFLSEGWNHNPGEVWAGREDGTGTVPGFYRLDLPDLENRERAFVFLTVHPEFRQRGIGRELLRHAAARAAGHSRTILDGVAVDGSPGVSFADRVGAKFSMAEVRRVQYPEKIAPGTIAGLRAEAAKAADGYSLISWTGPVPQEYEADVAHVFGAYNDAPHIAGEEDEIWDAARVRERTGSYERLGCFRGYTVAAVHDASGAMAGFTGLLVDPEAPQWGFQQLTAVVRGHRGHRLGVLLKTAMLEWLAVAEPQLACIVTGNAASNEHMISVNDTLGYEVVEPGWRFYEIPVADVG